MYATLNFEEIMNFEEFEDIIEEIRDIFEYHSFDSSKIRVSKKNGEIIIYTGLCQDNNGELSSLNEEESDYEEETDFDDSFGSIIDGEDEEVESEDE